MTRAIVACIRDRFSDTGVEGPVNSFRYSIPGSAGLAIKRTIAIPAVISNTFQMRLENNVGSTITALTVRIRTAVARRAE